MNRVNVLMVDDDLLDSAAIIHAVQAAGFQGQHRHAADGAEALAKLRGQDDRPVAQPCVVLLDLHLPGMDGLEFLRELRADPALRGTMVFVLTGSDNDNDRKAAYDLNVAGYIRKPRSSESLRSTMFILKSYLNMIELQR